ncbi:MAG: DUF4230 domain-containing protein [Lachnospiraceae bacterium]
MYKGGIFIENKIKTMAKKSFAKKVKLVIGIIVVVVMIVLALALYFFIANKNKQAEIITTSSLEQIICIDELYTYEVVYNGVASAMNENNPEKVDYYVSYTSTVKAGINLNDVNIDLKEAEEKKTIVISLPEVTLEKPSVDVASLDYIFVNKKAETETISADAFKLCIEDARKECESQEAIFKLARQNAENMLTALIKPFVDETGEVYDIEFIWGGEQDEE